MTCPAFTKFSLSWRQTKKKKKTKAKYIASDNDLSSGGMLGMGLVTGLNGVIKKGLKEKVVSGERAFEAGGAAKQRPKDGG